MTPPHAAVRPYDDVRALTYRFDERVAIAVAEGDIVQPDDVIAHVPNGPALVALADELRLSDAARVRTIARLDGATADAGELLGTQRASLTTRTAHAPIAGTVLGLSESGAIGIQPPGDIALRARYGGIVTDTAPGRLTIASEVSCIPFAFATGDIPTTLTLAATEAQVSQPVSKGMAVPRIAPDVLPVFAYAQSLTDLAVLRRGSLAAAMIGGVSEAMAWELLGAEADRAPGRAPSPAIIFLTVHGDRAVGAEAVSLLRAFDGLPIMVERARRLLVVYWNTVRLGAEEPDGTARDEAAVFRDPARWDMLCTVRDSPCITMLPSRLRVLARRTTSDTGGAETTPVANLAFLPERED